MIYTHVLKVGVAVFMIHSIGCRPDAARIRVCSSQGKPRQPNIRHYTPRSRDWAGRSGGLRSIVEEERIAVFKNMVVHRIRAEGR